VAGQLPNTKSPLDSYPYPRDGRSRAADGTLPDGLYAYVRDTNGIVYVVPDGPHIHPKALGQARPAMYAGDMTVNGGAVMDLTNLSGTFQFDDADGLLDAAAQLELQGLAIGLGAVRLFPGDGSPPKKLR
jgi:hypothetical protein